CCGSSAEDNSWSPIPRTIGWNNDRHAPALHIKDSDRETPARDRKEWKEFKATMGTHRDFVNATMEELHARIFEETERMVAESDLAYEKGESTYTLGINQFADWARTLYFKILIYQYHLYFLRRNKNSQES
ncbi:hypothetical protein PMAYCL1PPCAC_25834, partial [Pristionchus mayeri]